MTGLEPGQADRANSLPPIPLSHFRELIGLSPTTLWRMRKRGWLRVITIAGRHYVPREAIAEFNRRAEAGEFAGVVKTPQSSGRR